MTTPHRTNFIGSNCGASDRVEKLDKVIAREKVEARAIAVYTGELMKQIISSRERGEDPGLLIQKTWNEKRRVPEVQFVFMGKHHLEDLTYFQKHPREWVAFGQIVLSPEAAVEMVDKIKKVASVPIKEPLVVVKVLRAAKVSKVLVTFWKPLEW